MKHSHELMFEALLAREGGLYTVADIMENIRDGRMQSFASGDTWVITQICQYPRRKVMNIAYVVGDINALYELERTIIEFAKENGVDMLQATARLGWKKRMSVGWNDHALCMRKEI